VGVVSRWGRGILNESNRELEMFEVGEWGKGRRVSGNEEESSSLSKCWPTKLMTDTVSSLHKQTPTG
jgi:hypothetical protein